MRHRRPPSPWRAARCSSPARSVPGWQVGWKRSRIGSSAARSNAATSSAESPSQSITFAAVTPVEAIPARTSPSRARRRRVGRDDVAHQVHRRELEQVPGGHALVVADDAGAAVERARSGDPGAGQRGVRVEHDHQGRPVAEHLGEWGGGDRLHRERVGFQPVPAEPVVAAQPRGLRGDHRPQFVEAVHAGQIDPGGQVDADHRMAVPVDEAGGQHRRAEVQHPGPRPAPRAHVTALAERDDHAVPHGHRPGGWAGRVESVHPVADDDHVRGAHRPASSALSAGSGSGSGPSSACIDPMRA